MNQKTAQPAVKINPDRAGPLLNKTFMRVVFLEGPQGDLLKNHQHIASALIVALDKGAGEERSYACELLRSAGMKAVADAFAALLDSRQVGLDAITSYSILACELFSAKPAKPEAGSPSMDWKDDLKERLLNIGIAEENAERIVNCQYIGPRSLHFLDIIVDKFGEGAAEILAENYKVLAHSKKNFQSQLERMHAERAEKPAEPEAEVEQPVIEEQPAEPPAEEAQQPVAEETPTSQPAEPAAAEAGQPEGQWETELSDRLLQIGVPLEKIKEVLSHKKMGPKAVERTDLIIQEFGERSALLMLTRYATAYKLLMFNDTGFKTQVERFRRGLLLNEITGLINALTASSGDEFDYVKQFSYYALSTSFARNYEANNPGKMHEAFVLGRLRDVLKTGHTSQQMLHVLRGSSLWFGKNCEEREFRFQVEKRIFSSINSSNGKQLWDLLYDMGIDAGKRKDILEALGAATSPSVACKDTLTKLAELTDQLGDEARERVSELGAKLVTKPLQEILPQGSAELSESIAGSRIRSLIIDRLGEEAGGADKANAVSEMFLKKTMTAYNHANFQKAKPGRDFGEKVVERLGQYLEAETQNAKALDTLRSFASYFGCVEDERFAHFVDQRICGSCTLLSDESGEQLYFELLQNKAERDAIRQVFIGIGLDKNQLQLVRNRLEKLRMQFGNGDAFVAVNLLKADFLADADTFWKKVEHALHPEQNRFSQVLEGMGAAPEMITHILDSASPNLGLAAERLENLRANLDDGQTVFVAMQLGSALLAEEREFRKEVQKARAIYEIQSSLKDVVQPQKAAQITDLLSSLSYPLPFVDTSQRISSLLESEEGRHQLSSRPLDELFSEAKEAKDVPEKTVETPAAREPLEERIMEPRVEPTIPKTTAPTREAVEEGLRAVLDDLATPCLVERVCADTSKAMQRINKVRESLGGEYITKDAVVMLIDAFDGKLSFEEALPKIKEANLSASIEKKGINAQKAAEIAKGAQAAEFPAALLLRRLSELSEDAFLGSDFKIVIESHGDPVGFLTSGKEQYKNERCRLKKARRARIKKISDDVEILFGSASEITRLARKQPTFVTQEKIEKITSEFNDAPAGFLEERKPTILLLEYEQLKETIKDILDRKRSKERTELANTKQMIDLLGSADAVVRAKKRNPKILEITGDEFNRALLDEILAEAGLRPDPDVSAETAISRWREMTEKFSVPVAFKVLKQDNHLFACPQREFYSRIDHHSGLQELVKKLEAYGIEDTRALVEGVTDAARALKNLIEIEDVFGAKGVASFLKENPDLLTASDHKLTTTLYRELVRQEEEAKGIGGEQEEKKEAGQDEEKSRKEAILAAWKKELAALNIGKSADRSDAARYLASKGISPPKKAESLFELIAELRDELPRALVDSAAVRSDRRERHSKGQDLDSVISGIRFTEEERSMLKQYTDLDPRKLARVIYKTFYYKGTERKGTMQKTKRTFGTNCSHAGLNTEEAISALKELDLVSDNSRVQHDALLFFSAKSDSEGGRVLIQAINRAFEQSAAGGNRPLGGQHD